MVTTKMKIMALFFIILMFGSTLAYTINSLFSEKDDQLQIPQDKVLNYALNEQQKNYLVKNGYTLITYDYSSGCIECINIKKDLEKITQNSDGQIYLQEINSEGLNKINIISRNGQKIVNKPTINQTEEAVCNLLSQRPIWCLTSQI